FLGNTAGNGAVSPPSNAAAVMQRSASVSVFDHQINNYDINFGLEGARTASVFSLDMVEAIDFAALEAFAERYSLDFEYIYEYFSGNRQHVDAQFDSAYSVYITE
ncbi:MAG: hypothetical protein FWC75_09015, partial [Oscillospiraceae bacterium]|nr:hypothetical protein [Oscillospiraceae bacterium]